MIHFIYGDENREFLYFETLQSIKSKEKGIVEYIFDVATKEEDKFIEKLSFNSIFGARELLILKRAEKLASIDWLLDIFSGIDTNSKEVIVDFHHSSDKKVDKLETRLKEMEKKGILKAYKSVDTENRNIGYIFENLKISEKDALQLLEMIGKNPYKVKNEIEKLKNYLGDESYSISSARKIITVEKEYQIYEIIEKIMTNKIGEAFEYLNDNKEHMGILYSLYNEFEILKKMLDLKNQNINFSNNYNVFKGEFENYKTVFKNNGRIPHPYAIFNKKKYLENYTLEGVNEILYNCWETETNIKTGKIGMESGVERLITFISSKNNKK